MASSAVMLLLGFIVAIVLVVFLSNAAPSQTQVAEPTVQAVGAGAPQVSSMGGAGPGQGPVAEPQVPQAQAPVAMTYAPASSSNKDQIANGETLLEGSSLTSKNGKYVFTYLNGRAAIKSGNFSMWESTGTAFPGGVLKITDDGNVGIFSSAYSVSPIGWSSATAGRGASPYILQIRDDGNLVLFDSSNQIIWKPDVTLPPVGVDCVMDAWTDWSPCTAPCGGGTQMRTRAILRQGNPGGKACEATVETRACNEAVCPDCTLSDWSSWGACLNPNAQGVGTKTKTKTVTNPGGPGGLACPSPESSDMLAQESCQNCVYSAWTPNDWAATPCTASTGIKTQTRTITTPASNGGDACSEPLSRTQACTVDCQLNPWPTTWSACENKVNGVGKNTRTTTVKFFPKNGGKECTVASGVLTAGQSCDASGNCREERECKDCVQGTTYTYGACDSATGTKSRTRTGDVQATNDGVVCPDVTDTVNCDVDCAVSDWGAWGACDKTCGGGTQTRTRTVTTQKKNGGAECPALSESQACNTQECPRTVTSISTQFNDENPGAHGALWYHGNGQMNTNYRVRFGDAEPSPKQHNATGGGRYTMPDVYVTWDVPYTGTVWLESSAASWAKVAKLDVNNATSATFPAVSLTSIMNWNGKMVSTNGRCGPGFNGTACGGTACCSQWGWCGGTVNTRSDWCANPANSGFGGTVYRGVENGAYDGVAACSIQ